MKDTDNKTIHSEKFQKLLDEHPGKGGRWGITIIAAIMASLAIAWWYVR